MDIVGVQISVTLRMQSTAARVHDHEVEMESDAEGRRRLTRIQVRLISFLGPLSTYIAVNTNFLCACGRC